MLFLSLIWQLITVEEVEKMAKDKIGWYKEHIHVKLPNFMAIKFMKEIGKPMKIVTNERHKQEKDVNFKLFCFVCFWKPRKL